MSTNAENQGPGENPPTNNQPEPIRDGGGIEYNPNPEPPQPGFERITNILGRPIVDVYNPNLAAETPKQTVKHPIDHYEPNTNAEKPRSYYNYRVLAHPAPQPPADNQDARIFTPTRHQLPNGLTLTTNPDPMVENFYQNFIATAWHGQLKGQPNHLDFSSTYLVLTNLFGTTEHAPGPRIMAHSAVYSFLDLLQGETITNCWCITIHPVGEDSLGDYEQGNEEFYQQTLEKHQVNVKRLGLVDTNISLFDDELCELFHPNICDDLAKPVQDWVAKAETKWEYLWHVNTIFVDTDPTNANLAEATHQEAFAQAYSQPLLKTRTTAADKVAKETEITIPTPADNPKTGPLQGASLVLFHIQILTWWLNNLESIIRNCLADLKQNLIRQHATNVLKNTGYRLVNPITTRL